jgi:hypothetical protein
MAAAKRKPYERDEVVTKLMDGHYDRMLEDFQVQIDDATAALRRAYEAMKAENTLRS